MSDLRALLGDRYDDVMQAACGCNGTRLPHCYECDDSTWDHECPDPAPCRHRGAGAVLARVLPDLLHAAAADRDALAAKLDAVRALAEHYAGLTNVDAGGAILRALDAETGGCRP